MHTWLCPNFNIQSIDWILPLQTVRHCDLVCCVVIQLICKGSLFWFFFPTWMVLWLGSSNVCIHVSCVCVPQSPLVPPIVSLFSCMTSLPWVRRSCLQLLSIHVYSAWYSVWTVPTAKIKPFLLSVVHHSRLSFGGLSWTTSVFAEASTLLWWPCEVV